jgi:formate hydrogenlyase subunit 4
MWEMAHGLEWVALTGFVATMIMPAGGAGWLRALFFVAISFALVLLLSIFAAATGRLTLERSIRFYWRWAAILAVLAVSATAYMRFVS